MSFLDWDEKAKVNYPIMDKEHKNMVDDANQLYILLEQNLTDEANKLFSKIVSDLKTHFETEENLMKQSRIPYYISHKLEHERFYGKLKSLETKILSKKITLEFEHLETVRTWFFNHLDFKDRKLAQYLTDNNI